VITELARWLLRPFRRRTVRLRMTAMYTVLFLLSGAALLAIATGLVIGRSSREASTSEAGSALQGTSSSTTQSQLAHAQAVIRELQAQLNSDVQQPGPTLSHELLLASAIALGIMAVVATLLGWALAGRALRPLRVITDTARRISEDNLDERLAFAGPQDELKDLADTIDGLLERLEGAFRAQRRFVANASHELRTPLTTMRASIDVAVAKPSPVPAPTVALADRLRLELDRVDELLDGLLVLARAQHAALPNQGTISLADVASAALAARASAIRAMDLSLRTGIDPGDARIAGSPSLVSRMVANVVDNAIIHNRRGGWIVVTVATTGQVARVTVENGGAVLDQRQVAELGQPFRRLGADRIGSDRGSGLGLSIVSAIAAAHGGGLRLEARPGGGLRVAVTLPLAAQPALAGAPA
jgi:signal transduction histidine kinase